MEDTGRIRRPLDPRARQVVFGDHVEQAIRDELPFYVAIDRAHLVMLLERGILPRESGRRLLAAMDDLVARDYAPLRGRPAPRGLYLLYESWLVETLGEDVGGAVHLARSRNDINATVLRLRLRGTYRALAREVLRLLATLVRRAERHAGLTMPVYTHWQPALPVTYGHYLAGVAAALGRDLRGIEDAAADLDRCPLGAGAAGGTTIPIDTERTAALLGFAEGVRHSLDAVASRDLVLRLLAAAAVLGVTLSRVATDLQLWSTAELDLVRFPDELVGSSSMMPQKRNAFLLEHVKGRGGAPLGAFTAAAMAMHATPFSNSVAVGTEGVNIEAVESPRPVMHMGMVGRRFPLHASAACKAILAWRDPAEVRALLPARLERRTPATITDPERLLVELEEVRGRGYAVNWTELEEDLVAVAAPLRDHRGEVVAALSISAPVSRVPRESLPVLGRHVAEAARALSTDLGWR